ncbi:upstream activation factor subunit spp27-like [Acanthaster planci]|uniref:Upstream activation factor subunit spp27-like n=1 Tax=Acanthaster planci TaxID=133434 RepID=A0A8B7XL26_ACAPL|nr:upstream activation factor subunit spp27-like [Acanthaster planci]XP_022080661.1 upstream activation factor subunit spp27-like [Acanthaster planci]XP_022080662.1 upstream activation factor subunit spp27-like [Acanthaster planci]XP_022080663.1 upstream activation factor subunit spp27-like [Acanthaster planci]XP_022080664.1 upstream activation factor subunit spp27-like [Acanthaster planci]
MSEIFRGRIKEIVRGSDLTLLSSKKIREQLEQEFKTDLSKRKKEIDDIVMGLLVSESQNEESQNSPDEDDEDEVDSDNPVTLNSQPQKRKQHATNTTKGKKSKTDLSDEETETMSKDEELARKLQGESRSRTRRKQVKGPRKKESRKTPTKKDSLYQKEMVLSHELADIMGVNTMPRAKVVQRMWQIIKERNLSDPANKQYHICDDQLMKVFGKRRVRTFSMMKYLKAHIKDPDLLTNS